MVTVTLFAAELDNEKLGVPSGPRVSQVVTVPGTVKSSTTGFVLPWLLADCAFVPTPWLAKARQIRARFSPPFISLSANKMESRVSTNEGLHGDNWSPRRTNVSAKRAALLTAAAKGPTRSPRL